MVVDHEQLPPGEAPTLEELRQMFVMPWEVEPPIKIPIQDDEQGAVEVPVAAHEDDEIEPWMIAMSICSFIWGVVFTLYLYNVI